MIKLNPVLLIPTVMLVMAGCSNDQDMDPADSGYRHGIFITNEGAMGNSNGSITYIDPDSLNVTQHLFDAVNGRPLGDVVQSFTIAGSKGFIVVNNSQKVEVVEMESFKSIGTINGLEYPRFLVAADSTKGYLSDGNFGGRIYVIDLQQIRITDTIPCGSGPENMVITDDRLIVCNSGGFGNDSTLTVIDIQTDQVISTWQTWHNPVNLALDKSGRLWVLCKGKVEWNLDWTIKSETPSKILIMDPKNGSILDSAIIGAVGDFFWPVHVGISGDGSTVYFIESDGLYSMDVYGQTPVPGMLIPGNFYGFGINPDSGEILVLVSPSFTTSGWLVRYTPAGLYLDQFGVGIGPNQVIIN